MKRKRILIAAAVCALLAGCATKQQEHMNPFFSAYDTPYQVPPFDRITNESRGKYFSLGALGDSFYEYLLKAWLQGGKQENVETGGTG